MPLATQADVERHLQITFGTDPDPVVAQYLDEAQAIADRIAGMPLEESTGIVERWENDQFDPWHRLARFPVFAVDSVVVDGDTLDPSEYRIYPDGRIRRLAAGGQYEWYWSTLVDGNVVTYSAGYGGTVTTPADLVLAVSQIAAALFKHGARFAADTGAKPVRSISLDGSDSIEYVVDATEAVHGFVTPQGAIETLSPYRRRPM